MLAGVVVKPLKLIPDDRGFLMELLRSDEPVFEAFGQVYITGCKGGVAKAWHYHRPLVVHGFTAWDCDEARIINVPTLPYRYMDPDEFRYPWNSLEVPYTWPAGITRGG